MYIFSFGGGYEWIGGGGTDGWKRNMEMNRKPKDELSKSCTCFTLHLQKFGFRAFSHEYYQESFAVTQLSSVLFHLLSFGFGAFLFTLNPRAAPVACGWGFPFSLTYIADLSLISKYKCPHSVSPEGFVFYQAMNSGYDFSIMAGRVGASDCFPHQQFINVLSCRGGLNQIYRLRIWDEDSLRGTVGRKYFDEMRRRIGNEFFTNVDFFFWGEGEFNVVVWVAQ